MSGHHDNDYYINFVLMLCAMLLLIMLGVIWIYQDYEGLQMEKEALAMCGKYGGDKIVHDTEKGDRCVDSHTGKQIHRLPVTSARR
ncbi:hypothetical protein [Mesorhizobium sp. KR2-14]|uniref:hypothetical protein n=1 Tax=Mesorhizobium sp. KR2-14 TaxID=3156610 RepID=UPI0032B424D2